MLDIACGRGRHAIYLNKKGFEVTGIDLSFSSIKFAQQFANKNLQFFVQDMRQPFYVRYFDYAFNIFTSFGYFETDKDHIKALKSFNKALKNGGTLVFDYMNSQKIINHLVTKEIKEVDGIEFHISRQVVNGKIIKSINFEHRNKHFAFKEEVKDYKTADFERLFAAAGFEITHTFGDYLLNPFDVNQSNRLIFICKKTDA